MKGDRRVRQFRIIPQLLETLLSLGHMIECTDGIPEGSKVLNYGYDSTYDSFFLIVEHSSFDIVPEGGRIPEFDATLMCHTKCTRCGKI